METQRKQHCKSYKERHTERDREKLFASFLDPTTIKAWNFNTQIIRASSWWKTQTLDRQTDRQTEAKLAYWVEWNWKLTTESKMVFFVFRWWICSCNLLIQWQKQQQQQQQTEEGRKRRFLTTTPLKYLYSSLFLSLSFPPRNTRKTREE